MCPGPEEARFLVSKCIGSAKRRVFGSASVSNPSRGAFWHRPVTRILPIRHPSASGCVFQLRVCEGWHVYVLRFRVEPYTLNVSSAVQLWQERFRRSSSRKKPSLLILSCLSSSEQRGNKFPAKRDQLKRVEGLPFASQGQNLDFTALYVPYSLNCGLCFTCRFRYHLLVFGVCYLVFLHRVSRFLFRVDGLGSRV